jgi:hypothetical protein
VRSRIDHISLAAVLRATGMAGPRLPFDAAVRHTIQGIVGGPAGMRDRGDL